MLLETLMLNQQVRVSHALVNIVILMKSLKYLNKSKTKTAFKIFFEEGKVTNIRWLYS